MNKLTIVQTSENVAEIRDGVKVVGSLTKKMLREYHDWGRRSYDYEAYVIVLTDGKPINDISGAGFLFQTSIPANDSGAKARIASYCNDWQKARSITLSDMVAYNGSVYRVAAITDFTVWLKDESGVSNVPVSSVTVLS